MRGDELLDAVLDILVESRRDRRSTPRDETIHLGLNQTEPPSEIESTEAETDRALWRPLRWTFFLVLIGLLVISDTLAHAARDQFPSGLLLGLFVSLGVALIC